MSGLTHARIWHLVDASDKVLGKLANRISIALRGKYKPTYDPSDCGDYVVVINARKCHLTGNKVEQKKYTWHTGWPGGQRTATYAEKLIKHPDFPIKKAVFGMIPRNKLRRRQMSRLLIFPDEVHPYAGNILKDYQNYDEYSLSDKINDLLDSEEMKNASESKDDKTI